MSKVFTALVIVGLIFVHEGKSQCYNVTTCSGGIIDGVSDLRTCCVDTNNGLAFNDGPTCTVCIVHGFLQASYNVNEDSRLDTEFRLNVKGMTNFPTLVLSGTITAAAAGTTVGSDFQQISPITVDGSASIRVFTSNDDVTLEYDDRILLSFTTDNLQDIIDSLASGGEFLRHEATINITDNDFLEIDLRETDLAIHEGSTMLSTPMRLQFRENQNPFTVTLSPVSIAVAESKGLEIFFDSDTISEEFRATAGADFTENVITIAVPANLRSYEFDAFFNVTADNIDENEESFAVVAEIGQDVPDNISCFQIVDGQTGCTTERCGAARIRITDIDSMIIGFTNRTTIVSEGDGPVGFKNFSINIDLSTLRRAERINPMTIRYEETISNATVVAAGEAVESYDAAFGSGFNLNEPITQNVVLGELEDSFPIRVLIINDLSPEPFECFSLCITPGDVDGRQEVFSCNVDSDNAASYFCEHTICIIDDDDPFMVEYVETTYTAPETVGTVEICVNLTKPSFDILDETVNVFGIDFRNSIYIPENSSIATPEPHDFLGRYFMADMTDYRQQTVAVNELDDIIITQTIRIICYNQTIYNDLRLEPDEYFGMTLGVEDSQWTTIKTTVKPLFNQLSVLIVDDDMAVVGLEQTFFSVSEGVGVVELCVIVYEPGITCPIDFPFNVRLQTRDDTAVIPVDYGERNILLFFANCDELKCFNVTIVQDLIDESTEQFTYHLLRTPDLTPRITLSPVDGVVEIIDDHIPITVGYDPDSYIVSETDGSVTLTIRVFSPTSGAPRPFNLSINTADGTATVVDGDYVPVNGEIVTFNTGDVTQTHTITINQDDMCENDPNEIFFSHIALAGGITVTVPRANITIDNTAEPECGSTPIRTSITGESHAGVYTATASNRAGSSSTMLTINIEVMLVLFQIRLEGIFDCLQWKESEANEKREIVITSIIGAVNDICQCDFSRDSFHNIESTGGFQCFESSSTAVTFRASIMNSVEANVFQLVRYIKQWVQSDPTIVIMSSRLSVDGDCEVEIKSFNDPECGSTPNVQGDKQSSVIGPIVGGVFGGIVGLTLCLIIIPILFLIKRHRKSYKVKKIDANDLYETIPEPLQMIAMSPVGSTLEKPSHTNGSHIPTEENAAYATSISATDNPAYATTRQ